MCHTLFYNGDIDNWTQEGLWFNVEEALIPVGNMGFRFIKSFCIRHGRSNASDSCAYCSGKVKDILDNGKRRYICKEDNAIHN